MLLYRKSCFVDSEDWQVFPLQTCYSSLIFYLNLYGLFWYNSAIFKIFNFGSVEWHCHMYSCKTHNQKSAQVEYDKSLSLFMRSISITQRKIVSNYCFKQCSNILVYKILCFLMPFNTLRGNRNISLKNSKKNLCISPIVRDSNISTGRKYHFIIMFGNFMITTF